ncbi:peptide/nickel transport system substrate-binding protein [Thermocatellispora tengchongensis]|uniref:Peptide/nickel transport system substrate-binding protein n=1 Tax=Thermocatellispora tengchongensis TaxID=1073253 RepID=A0A840PGM0_9ACTN|nr:ABC transporter family substrate-binding protein [Thermocatellispora tengchongensis]MBB5135185.1 peptide/nickel transport system substrate-binding protein [Thermocatellispora tengchongensis]
MENGRRSASAAVAAVLVVATVLVVSMVSLAGCGEGGRAAAPAVSATLRAYDINPVPRGQVREGGTLRWGIDHYPSQWNLNHVNGRLPEVEAVMDALMPAPFRADERGIVAPDPDYLTRAEVTRGSPAQVVTLTLNPRARWSDGRPITWEDYHAQWRAMSGRDPAYQVAGTAGYRDIGSVARGAHDHQVVITFARPFADWRSLFTPLYPRSANATPDAFNGYWLNAIPVTAGPFKPAGLDPDARTVTVVRDPAWWGEKARLDRIVFRAMDAAARLRAFTAGELDVTDLGMSAEAVAKARASRDAVVRQAAGPGYRQLTLNGESPRLADPAVRQAVAMAIDRAELARAGLAGLGWPAVPLGNHFFLNTQAGYRDNSHEIGTYDPEAAAERLEDAGWVLDERTGVRRKDGAEPALRFVVPAGVAVSRAEGERVRAMLAEVGVKVTVVEVPADAFFTKHVIPGDFDIAPFTYAGSPFPVSASYAQYADAVTPPGGARTVGAGGPRVWNANLARIGHPTTDRALLRAMGELDPTRRLGYTHAADALLWRNVNVLPLYQRPQTVAVRASLANIGANGFRDLRYTDIGFTR